MAALRGAAARKGTAVTPVKPRLAAATASGIIYLRLSDFREETGLTFDAREQELRDLADDLGIEVRGEARIENDVDPVTHRIRGASAYKTPRRVRTSAGIVEFRTHRPVFEAVVRELG